MDTLIVKESAKVERLTAKRWREYLEYRYALVARKNMTEKLFQELPKRKGERKPVKRKLRELERLLKRSKQTRSAVKAGVIAELVTQGKIISPQWKRPKENNNE